MARLRIKFDAIANAAPLLVAQVAEDTAQDIVTMTKQLAPVDTGALRASYYSQRVDEDTIRIGSKYSDDNSDGVNYAVYVEYGTSNAAAQPHFSPAFWQARSTFEARLKDALAKLGR